MCLKSTIASIFRSKCSFGASMSTHSISIACLCSLFFITSFYHNQKKAARATFFDKQ